MKKYCLIKFKLTITVNTLIKNNDRSKVEAEKTNKQSQRHRNWQKFRQKIILKEQRDIITNRRTSRFTSRQTHTRAQRKANKTR